MSGTEDEKPVKKTLSPERLEHLRKCREIAMKKRQELAKENKQLKKEIPNEVVTTPVQNEEEETEINITKKKKAPKKINLVLSDSSDDDESEIVKLQKENELLRMKYKEYKAKSKTKPINIPKQKKEKPVRDPVKNMIKEDIQKVHQDYAYENWMKMRQALFS